MPHRTTHVKHNIPINPPLTLQKMYDTLTHSMSNTQLFTILTNELKKSEHVLLVAHQTPDADSLGSVLAMQTILKKWNIPHSLYCHTPIPTDVQFLYSTKIIMSDIPKNTDAICIFDAGDEQFAHIPEILLSLNHKPTIINIDHHASNTMFGDINIVIPEIPSTTALLYTYITFLGLKIDHTTANQLIAGLLNDTTHLTNPATSKQAFKISSQLLQHGADYTQNLKHLYQTKPIAVFKLWGRALKRLTKHRTLPLAYTIITEQDYQECGTSYEETSGLTNLLNNIIDTDISMILKETGTGLIKASLRTTKENIDVSRLALACGGGGHKKAAGFTLKGSIHKKNNAWQIH